MTNREPRRLAAVARRAAHAGGEVLRGHFRSGRPMQVETKGLHDFVTRVDREAEAAVLDVVRRECPDHAVMAEEGAPEAGDFKAPFRWVIDPLDGTTNFIHGVTPFAVSVAVEDARGPVAGAIYDPHHDETFHALRGAGAWLGDEPIRCTDPSSPGGALVATGFPFRELSRLDGYLKSFEAVVRCTAGVRRAGSAAIDLAYTACGRYDGFWEVGLSRWDVAAGVLLIREAGGLVSDVAGGEGYLDSGDIVAAGPNLHRTLLRITREAFGG